MVSERQNGMVLRVDFIQIGFEVCLFSFSVISQLDIAFFRTNWSGPSKNFMAERDLCSLDA